MDSCEPARDRGRAPNRMPVSSGIYDCIRALVNRTLSGRGDAWAGAVIRMGHEANKRRATMRANKRSS